MTNLRGRINKVNGLEDTREAFEMWLVSTYGLGDASKTTPYDAAFASYQHQQTKIDELEETLRKMTRPNIADLNIELIGLKS